jgi:hypothetical protein
MKDLQKLKLIEGRFSPKEGREILMNVLSSKLQFHKMKNFSSQERFNKDDEIAVRRIPQLENSMTKLAEILDEAEKNGEMLFIESEVAIHFDK